MDYSAVSRWDAQVLIYTGFGADFIKKNKMSPDGLAQMAWQALAL